MTKPKSAEAHTIEKPLYLHKTLSGSSYFECEPKITTGIKLVSHSIAVNLQVEIERLNIRVEALEDEIDIYRPIDEELNYVYGKLEEQKQLTASLVKTLEMAHQMLKDEYGMLYETWIEYKEIERVLNEAKGIEPITPPTPPSNPEEQSE